MKIKNENMTEGVLWKQILLFTLPIFLSSILQQFYNMVDTWFLGNFVGTNALAATGGTSSTYIGMTISFYNGFSSSIAIIVGQYFGSRHTEKVKSVIQNALAICLSVGFLLGLLCILITPTVLRASQVPDATYDMAKLYLTIYFSGTILTFTYNMSAGILRAMGDSRTPLLVLGLSCTVNIILDALFVIVIPWGVAGAAFATILSQGLSAVVNLYILFHRNPDYRFALKEWRLDFSILKRIVAMGIPCSISNMTYGLANMILQSAINQFGTNTVAAMSVYSKIDSMCWWAVESYGLALTTIVSQNYGAGKYKRIKKATLLGVTFAVLTELVFSSGIYLLAEPYFRMFTGDEETIRTGIQIIRTLAPFYVTYCLIDPLGGSIRGTGKTVGPMLITFFGVCVLRIVWVLTVSRDSGNFSLLLYNYPVTWTLTSTVFLLYYIHIYRKSLNRPDAVQG